LRSAYTNVAAQGEPWVWLTGGALATALAMITGLLLFILLRGASTFWPQPLELVELVGGRKTLGEITSREQAAAGPRRLMRSENFELTGSHYEWFDDAQIAASSRPEWATAVERLEGGRFHGFPARLMHGDEVIAEGAARTAAICSGNSARQGWPWCRPIFARAVTARPARQRGPPSRP
jgi:phosphate transport system permease protein